MPRIASSSLTADEPCTAKKRVSCFVISAMSLHPEQRFGVGEMDCNLLPDGLACMFGRCYAFAVPADAFVSSESSGGFAVMRTCVVCSSFLMLAVASSAPAWWVKGHGTIAEA